MLSVFSILLVLEHHLSCCVGLIGYGLTSLPSKMKTQRQKQPISHLYFHIYDKIELKLSIKKK